MAERKALFDGWAASYDDSVKITPGFPFAGYDEVLRGVVGGSRVEKGAKVLDVGTGTGALAAHFASLGCHVLGVDASEAMLARACLNVPKAQFVPLELLGSWDVLKGWRFDAVISSYVLHEFDLQAKMELLTQMASLLEPTGRIVVGDISFETMSALATAYKQWEDVWDKREHYWVAEEVGAALTAAGFQMRYEQVSFCAGVYILTTI